MNEQKDKPKSDIDFRLMALFFRIRDLFKNPEKLLQKVAFREGQIILDFGCGSGSYTIPAAEMVGAEGTVYALDIHPLAAKIVGKKARKKGLTNIATITSDRDTGLPDQSVDIVLLFDTIQCIQDKQALLEELHRAMKPGGILSILVEHIKVEDVIEIAEKDGRFSLRDRHDKLLNFERHGGS